MVRLLANLYGHPLAGLYWERHCHTALTKVGFHLVQGWECLYVHPEAKLFLSVYVDDFKMAGIKRNLAPMRQRLRKELDLDPSVLLDISTYLGCRQNNVQINPDIKRSIEAQRDLHATCMKEGHVIAADVNIESSSLVVAAAASQDPIPESPMRG